MSDQRRVASWSERVDGLAADGPHLATDEVQTKRLPWCPRCEAFEVPEDGECGVCGTAVEYREGPT